MTPPSDPDEHWSARASCARTDPDLWHSDQGDRAREARKICRRCPVRVQCAESRPIGVTGIWAGMSEREKRRKRK